MDALYGFASLEISILKSRSAAARFDMGPVWDSLVAVKIVLNARVNRKNAATACRVQAWLRLKASDVINAFFAHIANQKVLPFALATSDSVYAQNAYGLDDIGVAAVSARLREELVWERKSGTVRSASSIADLKK